jgi:outer membrane lipoprotein SlyB
MTANNVKHNHLTIKALAALSLFTLTGCQHPGQNTYGYQDVGQNAVVKFGTVIREREVDITGKNTGTGAGVGAVGGAVAGSFVGRGGGSLAGLLAGAVIGGVTGAVAEQAMADHKGIEYVITEEDGQTVTIVQNANKDEQPLKKGQRVMVQTSGTYQRVLPADDLPETIKRPKRIAVTD